jgi:DNA invertase Pin-like site-specific DNA recombinase
MASKKGPKSNTGGKNLSMKDFETTAAIYVRKSSDGDKRSGENMSLAAQKTECEAWAKANGLNIVETFTEPLGTSASKTLKKMKQFQKGLDGLGLKYHTLICHELSRSTRLDSLNVENAEWLKRVADSGGRVISLCGWIDTDGLDQMSNRVMLNLGFEFAAQEAEKISVRSKRGQAENRRRNKWNGGQPPFGLDIAIVDEHGTKDLVPNEKEIEAFKDACQMTLDGARSSEIAHKWNEAGVLTKKGGRWNSSAVSRLYRNHHWLGYRTYKGKPMLDDKGEPVNGPWGQLIDPAMLFGSREIISSRQVQKGQKKDWSTKEKQGKSLLAGLVYCHCGDRMNSTSSTCTYHKNAPQKRSYQRCQKCTPVHSVNQDYFYEHVIVSALTHLAQQKPSSDMITEVARVWLHQNDVGSLRMAKTLKGKAVELSARKDELLEMFTDGVISKDDFKEGVTKLDGKLLAIEAELASCPPEEIDITPLFDLLACCDGKSVSMIGEGSPWAALQHHQQRTIINCIVKEINVDKPEGAMPTTHIRERIKIDFNTDAECIEQATRSDQYNRRPRKRGFTKEEAEALVS